MLSVGLRAAGVGEDRPQDDLHLAVLTGRTKKIKHLLRKGVHIESVNSHGQTPLFCAAFGGDNEVVSLLLRLGANPNRRCGSQSASPVHGACYRGSRRVLRLLAEAGGDLRLLDGTDQTPRDYALRQPSPIRRQKILHFLDLLLNMTLHHHPAPARPPPLAHAASRTSLALKRQGSLASVWGACVTEVESAASPRSPPYTPGASSTLHKSVSCHLLDQMYVSTSLPLLSPQHLQRPDQPATAYTCGGPTVYSPYTWLGTNVTLRRPTPALSLPKHKPAKGEEDTALDQEACKSLLQELSVLRRFRHPAFLEVMAACHVTCPQPEHLSLVFQHVPLGSLHHHLHVEHHDLSVGGAVDILLGVVEALLFLHAHNWLHAAVSSHALHLISPRHAKLGGFEFAIEMLGQGCSMQAPSLGRATWLRPWQAPETATELMVSTRSEVYSLTAVIWELWSGMAPWSGVDEEEVVRRVRNGEVLPPLAGDPPSPVTYLTQYGLKWQPHERELDLQEIHTLLRSLKIQSSEDERVPAVPAWGPPSVPNTPVIGRHAPSPSQPATPTISSPSQAPHTTHRSPSVTTPSPPPATTPSSSHATTPTPPNSTTPTPPLSTTPTPGPQHIWAEKGRQKQEAGGTRPLRVALRDEPDRGLQRVQPAKAVATSDCKPLSRSPSPPLHTITSAKINPSFLTSTPIRTGPVLRHDLPPDLLPNKVSVKALAHAQTPDILARGPQHQRKTGANVARSPAAKLSPHQPPASPIIPSSPSLSRTSSPLGDEEPGYCYVSSAAKRAFLQEGDGTAPHDLFSTVPERPSSAARLECNQTQTQAPLEPNHRPDVVRRGLSLTNISISGASGVTRTTSHTSLASASSSSTSSSHSFGRPRRTVSQVTLTLKKLTHLSDSSSGKEDPADTRKDGSCQTLHKTPSPPNRRAREGSRWQEVTGIKPASHQVTRHASSCSLSSSGPPSPAHYGTPRSCTTLPTSPRHHPPKVGRRWNSVSGTTGSGGLGSGGVGGMGPTAIRIQPRRHSDAPRPRRGRGRRRPDLEVEEEFFDDEFNALLFQQPHMQLSVGSSENLLDSRAPHSMLADGSAAAAAASQRRLSPSLTPSEDEDDEAVEAMREAGGGNRVALHSWLGTLAENGLSDDSHEDNSDQQLPQPSGSASDDEAISSAWRYKEYEPLKSVELLRNLEKSLCTYLPSHSAGSDTDGADL